MIEKWFADFKQDCIIIDDIKLSHRLNSGVVSENIHKIILAVLELKIYDAGGVFYIFKGSILILCYLLSLFKIEIVKN